MIGAIKAHFLFAQTWGTAGPFVIQAQQMFALGLDEGLITFVGPFNLSAGQVFALGVIEGEVFVLGQAAGQVFVIGLSEGEITR